MYHPDAGGRSVVLRLAIAGLCAGSMMPVAAHATTEAAAAARTSRFEEIVVTAPRMREPLLVVTDPRQPRQPLPAHDGADFLKAIPGFSVIRKGGTDGDPVFRGMAASRVKITVDGQEVLGGCGMRMDPPTAYIFPAAYDRLSVVKGPQTVLEGPGNSAAAVSFERETPRFASPGFDGTARALAGSHGRADYVGELRAGAPSAYGQLTGTSAESDDYEDGDGEQVHSHYRRWSANGAVGWTPSPGTLLELSGAVSDGEAAYADRSMDGALFDRDNVGLRFERQLGFGPLTKVEALAYRNYVDHVMDNYSLRPFTPTAMMPFRTVSNPDRETTGGKVLVGMQFPTRVSVTAGIDLQRNEHTVRSTMNQSMQPYETLARVEDAWFRNAGVFGEATWTVRDRARVIGGLRVDDWQARDARENVSVGMMGSAPNPTAGDERSEALMSGFVRYERGLADAAATLYAGLGYVERFPDYWELVSTGKESVDSLSAFHTRPEKTAQLDVGLVHTHERLEASVSAYYSDVSDFILIESNYAKGMRLATVTRNVDARTWGAEADLAYRLLPSLQLTGTLAYTRGDNRTDDRPLAQLPPLETRLGVDWTRGAWSMGGLLRVVAEQDRYAVNQGNIVGQDLGPTAGFTVVSLNGGWRPTSSVEVTTGIDNLFDRTYAEHLSRSGAMVAGYEQTTRVNEPGRTFWVNVSAQFGGTGK